MLEQIESTIVAFVLGAVLTYFTTRWSKTLKKINKLEYGVQALYKWEEELHDKTKDN